MGWYALAKRSIELKKVDLKRWNELHKVIAQNLDIDIENDLEAFIEISDILRDLVDQLNRMPRYPEFLAVWKERHPEYQPKVAKCQTGKCSIAWSE